jgi:hypothetical protein
MPRLDDDVWRHRLASRAHPSERFCAASVPAAQQSTIILRAPHCRPGAPSFRP